MPVRYNFSQTTIVGNTATPVNPTDLANKDYVDNKQSGIIYKSFGIPVNSNLTNNADVPANSTTFTIAGNVVSTFPNNTYIAFNSVQSRSYYIITNAVYDGTTQTTITINRGTDLAVPNATPIYTVPVTNKSISSLAVEGAILPSVIDNNLNLEVLNLFTIQVDDPSVNDLTFGVGFWYNVTNKSLWAFNEANDTWILITSAILSLTTAPTTTTVGQTGQFAYVYTAGSTTATLYLCTNNTSPYNWIGFAGGSAGSLAGSCAVTMKGYGGSPINSLINYGAYSQFIVGNSNGATQSVITVTSGTFNLARVGNTVYGANVPNGTLINAIGTNTITLSAQVTTANGIPLTIAINSQANPIKAVYVIPAGSFTDAYSANTGRGYIADTQYITCNPTSSQQYGNGIRYVANMPWNRVGFDFTIDIGTLNFTLATRTQVANPNSYSSWLLEFIIANPVTNFNNRTNPTDAGNPISFLDSTDDDDKFTWLVPPTVSAVETQVLGLWQYNITITGGKLSINENANPINYTGSNTDWALMLVVQAVANNTTIIMGTTGLNYNASSWAMRQTIMLQSTGGGGSGGGYPTIASTSLTVTGSGTDSVTIDVPSSKTLVIPTTATAGQYVSNIDASGNQVKANLPASSSNVYLDVNKLYRDALYNNIALSDADADYLSGLTGTYANSNPDTFTFTNLTTAQTTYLSAYNNTPLAIRTGNASAIGTLSISGSNYVMNNCIQSGVGGSANTFPTTANVTVDVIAGSINNTILAKLSNSANLSSGKGLSFSNTDFTLGLDANNYFTLGLLKQPDGVSIYNNSSNKLTNPMYQDKLTPFSVYNYNNSRYTINVNDVGSMSITFDAGFTTASISVQTGSIASGDIVLLYSDNSYGYLIGSIPTSTITLTSIVLSTPNSFVVGTLYVLKFVKLAVIATPVVQKPVARFYANIAQSIAQQIDVTIFFPNQDVAQTVNGGLPTLGLTSSNNGGTYTNNSGSTRTFSVTASVTLSLPATASADYTGVLYLSNTTDNGVRYGANSGSAYLAPGTGGNQQTRILFVSAIITLTNNQGFNVRVWGTQAFSINGASYGSNNGNGYVTITQV